MVEQLIINLLTEKSQTVATVESCTGGLLASRLTDIPGASAVFQAGWITYSNEAKTKFLEVPAEIIELHGAVSREVAISMAEGAQRLSGATFCLATTGIAGPSGGTMQKPVGTIFMAIAKAGEETKAWEEFFPAERTAFKQVATEALLQKLYEQLKKTTC